MIVNLPLKPGQKVHVKAGHGRDAFKGTVYSLVVAQQSTFAVVMDGTGHTHHCNFDEIDGADHIVSLRREA